MDEPFVFSERHEKFPHHVIISQPLPTDGTWIAEKADDPSYLDRDTLGMLIALAKDAHILYVVVTTLPDGTCSTLLYPNQQST